MKRSWIAAVALATGIALGAPQASLAAQAQVDIALGGATLPAAEAEDAAAYETAMTAFQAGSYAALAPHLAKLRAALDRAPAKYPLLERTGPGRWVLRGADDQGQALARALVATAVAQAVDPGVDVRLETAPNVYGDIALMLGAEAVERRAFAEATAYLDRGLALQPANGLLAAEKMAVFQARGRFAEALALGDATVARAAADTPGGFMPGAGILHRRRGFSLIELGRLDEAQAAYETSLEHDADSAIAREELAYIEGLRGGAAPTKPLAIAPQAPARPAD